MKKTFLRLTAGLTAALFTVSTLAQTVPVSQFGYDTASQLTSATEPNGQSHAFQYNAFGELSLHFPPNPAGSGTTGQVGYGYNGQGALVSVTDPRGLATSYARDGFGDVATLTSPDTGVTNAVYDAAGNRTSYTDARGVSVSTVFDNLDRPTSVNYGDFTVGLGYDAGYGAGKLTSMSDASGSTTWTYDKLGRVVAREQVTAGSTLSASYSYFSGGRVATITYPSGVVVGFSYDGANVSGITVNGASVISGVTYFPFGAPKSWVMGGIGTYSRQADTYGRITSHTSEYGSRTLTWDASSRLTQVSETGQATKTYGYDGLNRLTSASETAAKTFAYDLTGNRTGETVNGSSFGYGVDSGSNRLSASSSDTHSHSYAYDAAGNITSDGTRTFAYDGAGQLTSVSNAGGVVAQYAYNGLGQRVRKVTSASANSYFYAEDGVSLLGEYGPSGVVSETVYLEGIPVLVLKGGSVYYVLPDHLNTPRAVKNTAGATVWRWNSDAFGKGAADENPSGVFQFTFNQRFPGQQFDAETGLHYNNARYYDPATGRYVTSDPIGLVGGLGTYGYADLAPTKAVDPSGNYAVYVASAVLGGLTGGVTSYMAQRATGNRTVNWKNVWVAAGAGAVGGLLLPFMGRFSAGSALVGALSNTGQTIATALVNCETVDAYDLLQSMVLGGVVGAIAPMAPAFRPNPKVAALFQPKPSKVDMARLFEPASVINGVDLSTTTALPSPLRCINTGKNAKGEPC